MIGLLSGIWILVGIVRTTLSIGISKHLYRTIRHSIVLNRVNEIILPKTIFVYKRNNFLWIIIVLIAWLLGSDNIEMLSLLYEIEYEIEIVTPKLRHIFTYKMNFENINYKCDL